MIAKSEPPRLARHAADHPAPRNSPTRIRTMMAPTAARLDRSAACGDGGSPPYRAAMDGIPPSSARQPRLQRPTQGVVLPALTRLTTAAH